MAHSIVAKKDFVTVVKERTDGQGDDLILKIVGCDRRGPDRKRLAVVRKRLDQVRGQRAVSHWGMPLKPLP
ncbi:MAG TPA: hypothetical protein PLI13_04575 [Paracoccus sp. (in: a-proteobacteria)]|nr:hypothetical protein [Paracoccus sp. (in: a-proteobacteria)]